MQYTYNRKLKRWTKHGRIVSRASVPPQQTFYYNAKNKRYYDIETGRFIAEAEASKRIYEAGGNVKILRKSKKGNFYKDNQKVIEIKKKTFKDKKATKQEYKNTTVLTNDLDISAFFSVAKEDENFIIIDYKGLIPYMLDFYKANNDDEYNNKRLYIFIDVEQVKAEGIYKQELGTQQLTEDNINKKNISRLLNSLIEQWVFVYERSQTYGAKILNIRAKAVLKQWKTY
jgi:hypothetical protein